MLYSISLPLYSISLQFKNKNIYIKKGKRSTAQFTYGSKETFSMKIKGTDTNKFWHLELIYIASGNVK